MLAPLKLPDPYQLALQPFEYPSEPWGIDVQVDKMRRELLRTAEARADRVWQRCACRVRGHRGGERILGTHPPIGLVGRGGDRSAPSRGHSTMMPLQRHPSPRVNPRGQVTAGNRREPRLDPAPHQLCRCAMRRLPDPARDPQSFHFNFLHRDK